VCYKLSENGGLITTRHFFLLNNAIFLKFQSIINSCFLSSLRSKDPIMSSVRYLILLAVLMCLSGSSFAQRGWQVQVGAGGGLTYIAAQNHYDNGNYQLNFNSTIGYSGIIGVGYGFNSNMGLILEGGMLQINQKWENKFRPGLGFVGEGIHKKEANLTYFNIAPQMRFATNFVDDYVMDAKLQGYIQTGFQLSFLGAAQMEYDLDGNIEPYPSKLRPYNATDYPYSPVSNDKDLFTNLALAFTLQIGLEYFVADKFSINLGLRGQASMTDINAKAYREHDEYKASRYFFGGLYLGLGYYINRG
jgi:opacity protein-like surface antigen